MIVIWLVFVCFMFCMGVVLGLWINVYNNETGYFSKEIHEIVKETKRRVLKEYEQGKK